MTIRIIMDTVKKINFALSHSAKCTLRFRASLDATPHKLEKRSKLRELCETCWSTRGDALYTFWQVLTWSSMLWIWSKQLRRLMLLRSSYNMKGMTMPCKMSCIRRLKLSLISMMWTT